MLDTSTLTKYLANVAMFVLCLGAGAILAIELLSNKPLDPTLLTFEAFIIGNYAKTIGFDQGAVATNKTIESVNGAAAKTASAVVNTLLPSIGGNSNATGTGTQQAGNQSEH